MKSAKLICIFLSAMLMIGCTEHPMMQQVEPDMQDSPTVLKGKKPEPKLVGTSTEYFTGDSSYPCMGTIDFSDNEGYGVYYIAYEIVEMSGNPKASAGFFREYFYIYDVENPEDGVVYLPEDGDVYLSGINEGVFIRGTNFFTHGEVEMATGPFEGWCGRKVHVRGQVTEFGDMGNPLSLVSTYRLN